jgi:hypothetical protein
MYTIKHCPYKRNEQPFTYRQRFALAVEAVYFMLKVNSDNIYWNAEHTIAFSHENEPVYMEGEKTIYFKEFYETVIEVGDA